MKVNHPIFGQGQVKSQDDKLVTVDFNGLEKTLVIAFSKLTNEDGTVFGAVYVAPKQKSFKKNKSNFMSKEEYANSSVAKMSNDDFEEMRKKAMWASKSM